MTLRGFAGERVTYELIPQELEETANVLSQPRVECKRNEMWSPESWPSLGVATHRHGGRTAKGRLHSVVHCDAA